MSGNLSRLGAGLAQLPRTLTEMLTSQEGFIPFGIAVILLGVVGGVGLWRKGRRLAPTILVLGPFCLAAAGGAGGIHSRYLLPLLPLVLYTLMEGLCWIVKGVCQWRSRPASPRAFLLTATIVTGVLVFVNSPRLLRNAFYYSYLSHTSRYYEVIRHGRHAELFPVAEVLRQHVPSDERVMVNRDTVRTLHYLSERLTADLPKTRRDTLADAAAVHDNFASRPEARFVVLNTHSGSRVFLERLKALFAPAPDLQVLYDGDYYRVCRREKPGS
jgi:hypothetical protein